MHSPLLLYHYTQINRLTLNFPSPYLAQNVQQARSYQHRIMIAASARRTGGVSKNNYIVILPAQE